MLVHHHELLSICFWSSCSDVHFRRTSSRRCVIRLIVDIVLLYSVIQVRVTHITLSLMNNPMPTNRRESSVMPLQVRTILTLLNLQRIYNHIIRSDVPCRNSRCASGLALRVSRRCNTMDQLESIRCIPTLRYSSKSRIHEMHISGKLPFGCDIPTKILTTDRVDIQPSLVISI